MCLDEDIDRSLNNQVDSGRLLSCTLYGSIQLTMFGVPGNTRTLKPKPCTGCHGIWEAFNNHVYPLWLVDLVHLPPRFLHSLRLRCAVLGYRDYCSNIILVST